MCVLLASHDLLVHKLLEYLIRTHHERFHWQAYLQKAVHEM